MIKAVLFDLDGTLSDSIPQLYQHYLNFLAGFDIIGSREEFADLHYPLYIAVDILKQRYDLKPPLADLLPAYIANINSDYHLVAPIAHSENLLKTLKKNDIIIGLVTANVTKRATDWLQHNHLLDYFDFMVTSDDVTNSKPYPDCYLQGIHKAQELNPKITIADIIAVEDSSTGAQSARDANLQTLSVTVDLPDCFYCRDLKAVEDYILAS